MFYPCQSLRTGLKVHPLSPNYFRVWLRRIPPISSSADEPGEAPKRKFWSVDGLFEWTKALAEAPSLSKYNTMFRVCQGEELGMCWVKNWVGFNRSPYHLLSWNFLSSKYKYITAMESWSSSVVLL